MLRAYAAAVRTDRRRPGTRPWARARAAPLRAVGAAFVCVTGVAFVGLHARAGIASTRELTAPTARERATWLYEWDPCIEAALRRRVPAGSTVYIPPQDPYWAQGLDALATPCFEVVPDRAGAEYLLTVGVATRRTPRSQRCGEPADGPVPARAWPIGVSLALTVTEPA